MHPAAPTLPADCTDVPTWSDVSPFGASGRLVGGKPDALYGWLIHEGQPCVVKALDPDLVAYNRTLLDHERRMLRRLATLGAPAPRLVEVGRDDWLVTGFAGLSLAQLGRPGRIGGAAPLARFPVAERLAAWVHLLRRLQPMADRGVLALDIHESNVVLPLADITRGHLRLHEAVLIDHAHTLEAGMAMRRPVWLDHRMARIPPELAAALRSDQDALRAHVHAAGAVLPGAVAPNAASDALSRRIWAEYDAPQLLQQQLDAGALNRDQAMQFAAATAIATLLPLLDTPSAREPLARVLRRMTHTQPSARFATLTEAADALETLMSKLPMASRHAFATIGPEDLRAAACTPPPAMHAMPEAPEAPDEPGAPEMPEMPSKPAPPPAAAPERAPRRTAPVPRAQPSAVASSGAWLYAAAAVGAAAGVLASWPW